MQLHGPRRYPTALSQFWPPSEEALFFHNVGLWQDARHRGNLFFANFQGASESWAILTDESPTLQTLWQYALRFRVEELFLDSKSGAFELEQTRIRSAQALERLYLITAVALLYSTSYGVAVQLEGLLRQVDPHW